MCCLGLFEREVLLDRGEVWGDVVGETHRPRVALLAHSDAGGFFAGVPEPAASDVGVHALATHALCAGE